MSADIERRLQNLIRVGTVHEINGDKASVDMGDGWITEALPWTVRRAHGDIEWWAPEVGEQVVVLSPGGVIEDGVIAWSLYQSDHPAPANSPDMHVVQYKNGASVTHNRATGDMVFDVKGAFKVSAGGAVSIAAAGAVTLVGATIALN